MITEKEHALNQLEKTNYDLNNAFNQKSKALQEQTRKYHALKAQRMTEEQQNAASDEAEQAIHAVSAAHNRVYSMQGYPNRGPVTTQYPSQSSQHWQTRSAMPATAPRTQSRIGSRSQRRCMTILS